MCILGQPDRGARGGRHGQAQPELRGDVARSRGAGQPDPGHGHLRAQLVEVRAGRLDVHLGHASAGRTQQPGSENLRRVGGHDLVRGPAGAFDELRQVACARIAPQPDRHRAAAGVVGQHDQVAARLESAVRQSPGPGLGERDADGSHQRCVHTP
jgi:hypothetical protein